MSVASSAVAARFWPACSPGPRSLNILVDPPSTSWLLAFRSTATFCRQAHWLVACRGPAQPGLMAANKAKVLTAALYAPSRQEWQPYICRATAKSWERAVCNALALQGADGSYVARCTVEATQPEGGHPGRAGGNELSAPLATAHCQECSHVLSPCPAPSTAPGCCASRWRHAAVRLRGARAPRRHSRSCSNGHCGCLEPCCQVT